MPKKIIILASGEALTLKTSFAIFNTKPKLRFSAYGAIKDKQASMHEQKIENPLFLF